MDSIACSRASALGLRSTPLWGFLAYDLVLFGPYLRMLSAGGAAFDDYGGDGASVNMTSLSIYLTVLAGSSLLTLYYLFVHASTRLVRRRADVRATRSGDNLI